MLVIADTGALISLGHINKIHLFEEIFGDILIPEAVWDELNSYKHPECRSIFFKIAAESNTGRFRRRKNQVDDPYARQTILANFRIKN